MVPTCPLLTSSNSLSSLYLKYVRIGYTFLPFFKKAIPKMNQPLTRKRGTVSNFKKPAMNADWSLLHSRWQGWKWCQGQTGGGSPTQDSLRKKPTIPRRVSQLREAAEGVTGSNWSLGSSPSRQLVRMAVEAGPTPLTSGGKWASWGPLLAGRHPQGVLKGGWRGPEALAGDGGSLWDMAIPQEHQACHLQAAFCMPGA